jgi:hypothetical protein
MSWLVGQLIGSEFRVLKEFSVKNSNTEHLCSHILDWLQTIPGKHILKVYGDASGTARKTSASKTDYEIIRSFFQNQSNVECRLDVPHANPHVKDRVNSTNAVLRAADGRRRLFINKDCKELITDLRQVSYKPEVFELDKSDPMRTHMSDALGYWIHREAPVKSFRREILSPDGTYKTN